MVRKLNDQDRQAIDLVMDRFASVGPDDTVSAMAAAPTDSHVQSVEQILRLLARMPAQDPSDELLTRTLRRIDQSHPSESRQIPPYLGPDQLPA